MTAVAMVLQAEAPKLTHARKVEFLLNAKVVKTKAARKGITGSLQATLDDGKGIFFISASQFVPRTTPDNVQGSAHIAPRDHRRD